MKESIDDLWRKRDAACLDHALTSMAWTSDQQDRSGPKPGKREYADLLRERLHEPEVERGTEGTEGEVIVAGRTRGAAIHQLWHGGGEGFGVREGVTDEHARGTRERLAALEEAEERAEEQLAWSGACPPPPDTGGADNEGTYEGCRTQAQRWRRWEELDRAVRENAYGKELRDARDAALEDDYVEYVVARIDPESYLGRYGTDYRSLGPCEGLDEAALLARALEEIEAWPAPVTLSHGAWIMDGAFAAEYCGRREE